MGWAFRVLDSAWSHAESLMQSLDVGLMARDSRMFLIHRLLSPRWIRTGEPGLRTAGEPHGFGCRPAHKPRVDARYQSTTGLGFWERGCCNFCTGALNLERSTFRPSQMMKWNAPYHSTMRSQSANLRTRLLTLEGRLMIVVRMD